MVAARNLPNNHPQTIPWETYEAIRKQLQTANQKIRELEQELKQEKAEKWQERALWKRKEYKPAMKAGIIEVQRQIDRSEQKDSEGYTRICFETASRHIGMDSSAPPRLINNIIEQCPNLPWETKTVDEYTADGKKIPRLYVKAEENLIQAAATIEISEEKIRKQGGNQYACQGRLPSGETCGSKNVTIERELVCHDCGHRSKLDPTYPNGQIKTKKSKTSRNNLFSRDSELVAKNFAESEQVVDVVLKPDTPPIVQPESLGQDEMRDAQFLLLSIAGIDSAHIEMVGEQDGLKCARPSPSAK